MTHEPPDSPGSTHSVRLFVAAFGVLARFSELASEAGIFALTPGASLLVLPFDEDVQDSLHRRYGTGDWPETAAHALTTSDLAFAAEVSRAGPIAYLETDYRGAMGSQTAALWVAGHFAIPPLTIDTRTALSRPASVWPINAALRGLGVLAAPPHDEFTTFGLRTWTSNAAIRDHARRIA